MSEKRVFGLDILRAVAVILVLLAHFGARVNIETLRHVADYNPILHTVFSASEKFGIFGVEIFFVLSGFLIGQIIIKQVAKGLTPESIRVFYIRRWFRTLPPYFLVLLGLMLIDNVRSGVWDFHPWYFVFLQNFFPHSLEFFNVSWSLAIEEWFYLLLPVLFFLTIPRKSEGASSKRILTVILACMALVFLARCLVVAFWNPAFDFGIRRCIPLRFDSMMTGVLLACLRLHYKTIYQSLVRPWVALGGGLLLVLAFSVVLWHSDHVDPRLNEFVLFKVFGFPMISIGTALCIPFLESASLVNLRLASNPLAYHFFTRMSLYSYSMYLTHATIFYVFSVLLPMTAFAGIFGVQVFALAVSVGFSALLYHFFEKPCMNLRERFGGRASKDNTVSLSIPETAGAVADRAS